MFWEAYKQDYHFVLGSKTASHRAGPLESLEVESIPILGLR